MAYTVLARKYRSQSFDEVVGQEPIAQTLKNAIKSDRVAHAYLFSGTRGVGKTTMARIFAKALNCQSSDGPTIEPCCKCESCIAVNAGDDIDVIEIDGASNNSVDQVRQLRENAIYRPARSRFKIYIIDEVHMLTTSAFNALLKILEEPPGHVKFIFATTEPNKVIATIQSRCQRFDFNNISAPAIAGQLEKILGYENIAYEKDLVLPLAKMADGSMRDGLSLLDRLLSTGAGKLDASLLEQYLGCPNSEKVHNLAAAIGDSNSAAALEATDDLITGGITELQIVDALVDIMRDLMVAKSSGSATELLVMTKEQKAKLEQLAGKFDIAALVYNITALEKLRWSIKNTEKARALLEASILRFALSEHFLNVDQLLAGGGSDKGSVKKKTLASPASKNHSIQQTQEKEEEIAISNEVPIDISSVKDNWEQVFEFICEKVGAGTAGLLNGAEPIGFDKGVLALGVVSDTSKRMCEAGSRKGQIESAFKDYFGQTVRVEFQTIGGEKSAEDKEQKTGSQKRNELVNDPAVRTVLMELDATITDIQHQ